MVVVVVEVSKVVIELVSLSLFVVGVVSSSSSEASWLKAVGFLAGADLFGSAGPFF